MPEFDLIVIGAGPAGMVAASTAAQGGLDVLLLDEQERPGGQIYRNVGEKGLSKGWLGKDYAAGAQYIDALGHPRVTAEFGATVWRLEPCPRVVWARDGVSLIATARHVVLASGAQERPVPFPGWTLPGVMTAGAAQILMKSAGMLPRDAVLAGSGPLLYLVAAQMIDAGCPPKALVETQSVRMMLRALPHLPKALFGMRTLLKGLGLLHKIRKAGVRRYTSASDFAACDNADGTLDFSFRSGSERQMVRCGVLLTHQGVIPSTHMSRTAGIAHEWNAAQVAFQPVTDVWGTTNQPELHIAGDGAGIGGAEAAAAAGELVAMNILKACGKLSTDMRDERAAHARAALFRARAIRPFLDAAYTPPADILSPPDETIVCRCEEITAGEIRIGIGEGVSGHRQIKTGLRTGMGPCQGRMCDATVRGILTAASDDSKNARIAPPRARSPIKPVTLGALAALSPNQEEAG